MKKYTKKPNGHWNKKENCVAEAQKYANIRDWQLGSPGSLAGAYKNGWMHDCTSHMTNHKSEMLDYETSEKERQEENKKRIEAEGKVLEFLGMGKKVLFFQDAA